LYANNGAGTKGIDDDTADGFSEEKIANIIKTLSDGTYQPKPVRRTYIQKQNGKMRPLGIPTFTDKLVQEILRMVLEAVYEPVFLNCSHGFRPNKSCHTALKDVKHQFPGTRWFIEGDIKGCFDNINHCALISFINNKIKDARLIQLLHKILKAGYLEDWRYNTTHSGTPQGGIVSPILANIYLHELDKYVMKLKSEFDKPRESQYTPEYHQAALEVKRIRSHLRYCHSDEHKQELLKSLGEARTAMMKIPSKSQTDKAIKYIRYADDFILGVNGSKTDCETIKGKLSVFVSDTLKMELSDEKTLITHSANFARFLGYDVRIRHDNSISSHKRSGTQRVFSQKVEMLIPIEDKLNRFLFDHGVVEQENGTLKPCKRKSLLRLTDFEIVSSYNAELRGICNYYNLASNFCDLHYFSWLMNRSCQKTLAGKHRCKTSAIRNMFKDGMGSWGIPYETKAGNKRLYFANFRDSKDVKNASDRIANAALMNRYNTTTFESRLKAKVCELCGTTEAEHYEIHHVNKVKNLKGKEPWEMVMIAKRRKTITLCRDCHKKIHKN
jgi:group II intron reverse transcriptase/maturase